MGDGDPLAGLRRVRQALVDLVAKQLRALVLLELIDSRRPALRFKMDVEGSQRMNLALRGVGGGLIAELPHQARVCPG